LLRLRTEGKSREQRIAAYAGIASDHPSVELARAELCLLLFEDWRASEPDEPDQDRRSEQILDAVRAYFTTHYTSAGGTGRGTTAAAAVTAKSGSTPAAEASASPPMELRIAMIGAEVLLAAPRTGAAEQQQAARRREAGEWLARAEALTRGMPESSSVVLELHYRQLQLAEWEGNNPRLRREADYLTRRGAGSAYETPALLLQARRLDEALRNAARNAEPEQALLEQAHEAFERLSRRLGDDAATLRNDANARSALTRLAQLDLHLRRHAAAAARFERLLEARPNDRNYLRSAATAYTQAGEPAKALPKWRALAAGLPKGTPDWFEAKFHQLDCLASVDRPACRDAFRQFQLLYPQLGDETWRPLFQELERRLQ
jgi:tetratricopeptide (TPR) repeat protein